MTAYSNFISDSKVKNWPSFPHWFFIIMALVISIAVAGKASTSNNVSGVFLAQNKGETVGRKAAKKYFKKEVKPESSSQAEEDESSESSEPRRVGQISRFMAIHVGTFFNDESFSWGGTRNVEGAGDYGVGVTYRVSDWTDSMDFLFRGEWLTYELPEGDSSKLSFSGLLQFPEASSGFPLFFGLGLGLGVFTKQISNESDVSLDYQLVGGARFFNLYESIGLVAELGLKNHFHVFSSGQFNSLFFSIGTLFTF